VYKSDGDIFQNLGNKNVETSVFVVPTKLVDVVLCSEGFAVNLDVFLEFVVSRGPP
jgi:hypothetical protein